MIDYRRRSRYWLRRRLAGRLSGGARGGGVGSLSRSGGCWRVDCHRIVGHGLDPAHWSGRRYAGAVGGTALAQRYLRAFDLSGPRSLHCYQE